MKGENTMYEAYATVYGDKKLIKILNSISTTDRGEFNRLLSNKTSEMKLTEQRKQRLRFLANIRMKELNIF